MKKMEEKDIFALIIFIFWVFLSLMLGLSHIFSSSLFEPLALFSFSLLGCCMLFLVVFLIYMLSHKKSKRSESWIITGLVVYIVIQFSCFFVGGKVQHRRIIRATENAKPLIGAIRMYQKDHGAPPSNLKDLVPKYIPKIPDTGLDGSHFELGRIYGVKSWTLQFNPGPSSEMIYFSNQEVPKGFDIDKDMPEWGRSTLD